MRVCADAVLDEVRRDDPEGYRATEEMLSVLPPWVTEIDRCAEVPKDVWAALSVAVLNRAGIPPRWGGLPMHATAVRRAVLFERLGRICPAFALALPGPALAMPTVARLGTDLQQREYFESFHDARPRWAAFAFTEPTGGTNATSMSTTARRDGDTFVINGRKCFITNGDRAQSTVLFATLDPARGPFGIRAFVVDAGTPGFEVEGCEDMMGMRASRLATLAFTECRVPEERMLGIGARSAARVNGFVGATSAWDYMRPGLSATINGACAGVLERVQELIGGSDSELTARARAEVADQLGRWRTRVETSQLLVLRAAWLYDQGVTGGPAASIAKAFASATATGLSTWLGQVMPIAVAVAGNAIEKFCRDARAFDILEGTGDAHRMIVSRTFQVPNPAMSGAGERRAR